MKIASKLIATFTLLLSAGAEAGPVTCNDQAKDAVYEAAILSKKPSHLALAQEIEDSRKRQIDSPSPNFDNAVKIEWSDAKLLVLLGHISQTSQQHNLTVFLWSKSGRLYESKETKIDEIYELMRKVDPCHLFITQETE
jgi:hypothetical protein